MSNKITLKKSSVGDKVPLPGDLEYGELALNYTDGNLFYKNSSNVITTIASNKFVSVTGNVTGNYFIGDGSQLTNVPTGTVSIFITGGSMGTITAPVTEEEDLGQVSVESTQNLTLGTLLVDGLVDNSSIIDGVITGNKLASDINIVTTGNITAGYFLGDGSQLTNLPAGNYSNANVATYLASGNVTSNVVTSGNISAGYFLGDGSLLTGLAANYSDANVATYLASGNVTSNVVTTGNISASYFLGDGSQLTNLPAGNYSNANVATYLASGNVTSNVVTSGNISAGYFLGDGSQLTGLPDSYSNADVAAYLAGGDVTSNVVTSGNVSASYFIGNGSLLTGLPESYSNANVATYLASGDVTSNVVTSGNITGAVFIGSAAGLTSIPGANVAGAVANATYATSAATADTVTTAAQGNITSVGTLISLSVSGNVQSGNLLTAGLISATGNVVGGNINTSGQVSATGNVVGGGITLSGNTIFSTGSTLTIDPSAVGVTGTVVIAGNLTVQGSTTTYDSTTVTINDLLFTVANNAATASAANGGGIEVGPVGSPYATWTYDQPTSRWKTSLGISATGNVLGGNILTSGLISATGQITGSQFNGSGAGLSSIPGANVTGTVANATYATSAGSVTTATNLSGGTVSATTGTFSGLIKADGGTIQVGSSAGVYRQFRYDGTISSDGTNFYTLLNANNYNSYALPLSGGTMSGQISTRTTTGATPIINAAGSNSLQIMGDGSNGAWLSFHRSGAYAINMGLDTNNILTCGGWSDGANYRWQSDSSGNFTARADVTAYSDERLKKDWAPVADNFVERLANIKSGTYTRIDIEQRQAGVSAQEWQTLLAETVQVDKEGILSIAYGNAALVASIELAKKVVEQEQRIKRLEALIEKLIGE